MESLSIIWKINASWKIHCDSNCMNTKLAGQAYYNDWTFSLDSVLYLPIQSWCPDPKRKREESVTYVKPVGELTHSYGELSGKMNKELFLS